MMAVSVPPLWLWLSGGLVALLLLVIAWLWTLASRRAQAAKSANQLLDLSQQQLCYALKGSSLALWDYNVERDEIYLSEHIGSILDEQVAPNIMSRAQYLETIHPDDREAATTALNARFYETASGYRVRYRMRAQDGKWKWLRSYGKVAEKNAQAQATRVTGTIEDITELHEAQEYAHLLTRAVEESVEGILIADATQADTPIVYCNSAIEYMTGYSSEEILGRNARFLQGEEHEQDALETIRQAQTSGNAAKSLLRNYRKDGSMFWNELSISPVHDENGKLTHYIGTVHDVTARVKAKEALRYENEVSTAAINALPGMFFVLNKHGKLLRLNENVGFITGYSEKELANMSPLDYCVEEDRKLLASKIAECFDKGEAHSELRVLAKDGRQLPFYFQTKLHVLGGTECIVGTGIDISEVKRMQQELIQSQSLLNTLVEHIPAMVFLKRADDLRYTLLNKAGEQILEYTREEVLGKTDDELFTPEQARLMTEVDRNVLSSKKLRVIPETVLTGRSGWVRYLHTIKTALCDEQGEATYLLGIAVDVSDRKRAEIKQKTSEKLLKEAQRIAHLGNWSLDIAKHEVYWSDELFRIVGRDRNSYVASYENFFACVHPDDVDVIKQSEQRAFAEGTPHSVDARIILPSGEPRWVHIEANIVKWDDGKPRRLAGTIQDITDRKNIEQAVKHGKSRLRTILETAVDSIIIIDEKGIIESANPATEKLFGYTVDELIGCNVSMLMPEPDRSAHDGYLEKYQETNKAKIIGIGRETQARRKDGTTFPIDLAVSETWFEDRRRFTGFVRDISERKEAEDKLLLAKEQAEQASRAKSEFLSNMSHELRTPMNAILGFAQLLEESEPPLASDHKQDVEEILQAGQHLLSLINELLDLARIEAGQMQVSLEPVALRTIVNECRLMIEPLLLKHEVRFELPEEPAMEKMVLADRHRLRQVLLNLLSNAVKYNRVGGEVSIACKHTSNGHVRIEVQDTGIGIAPDRHDELFQLFSRLEADETAIEGTGIGLAITRRLVDLMHGEIGVESQSGCGSVFWVELREVDEPQRSEIENIEPFAISQNETLSDNTILYIEDNPANIRFMTNLIQRRTNLRLITASKPEEGLLLAESQHPDLILLDIQLPEMDGFEVHSRLQASEATQDIPVIAVSANAMPDVIKRAHEAGFNDYCTKPIDVRQFMQTIDNILKPEEIER